MGRVAGKVALISGVARGQGRSHAVRLAEEGADIIGFDVCADLGSVAYPLATPEDLEETKLLIEKHGRRAFLRRADVRDIAAVKTVINEGVAEFGRLDIVLANAGIMPTVGEQCTTDEAFYDSVQIMLNGVYNTVHPAIPHIKAAGNGGSVVITSSTAGLRGTGDGTSGVLGYVAAKHGVVGLMRAWANAFAKDNIRFNTVHPTGVNTPMIDNEAFRDFVAQHPEIVDNLQNPLWIPEAGMLEASDVTNLVMHLVSPEGRYTTGATMTVDAGFTNKV
ncbi:mycofactocin-coupled SDR family oxidoreductase [Rhodococcus rhodochrous]|uniref:mycofactocin-coupled SDR family oxidoreductase n=1 Tax=Rhodococcus rhodochrous TaxID=1829 RepID=UPI001E4ACDD5|nr:mycofactocin-coupled SDR family oxidoreductase [Rhodococcus rhodochrous]MCB8914162.1 mycofactocin-coupled SDR family oxidoreductase [Rhodococcus rhodochrous]